MFSAVETVMLQIYSTVYEHTIKNIFSQAHLKKVIMKVNSSSLHFRTNAIYLMFTFLTNLNRFGLDHTKLLTDYLMLHLNTFLKRVHLPYTQKGYHGTSYYPQEPLLYPQFCNFMLFSDSIQYDIPKPMKYANSDSSPSISDESLCGISGRISRISRSPISELPNSSYSQSQPSPVHTPLIHIPNPVMVARFVN